MHIYLYLLASWVGGTQWKGKSLFIPVVFSAAENLFLGKCCYFETFNFVVKTQRSYSISLLTLYLQVAVSCLVDRCVVVRGPWSCSFRHKISCWNLITTVMTTSTTSTATAAVGGGSRAPAFFWPFFELPYVLLTVVRWCFLLIYCYYELTFWLVTHHIPFSSGWWWIDWYNQPEMGVDFQR